jgi:hypothetical protein
VNKNDVAVNEVHLRPVSSYCAAAVCAYGMSPRHVRNSTNYK